MGLDTQEEAGTQVFKGFVRINNSSLYDYLGIVREVMKTTGLFEVSDRECQFLDRMCEFAKHCINVASHF